METQRHNDPAELLDLMIGELEIDLPPNTPAGRSCVSRWCE